MYKTIIVEKGQEPITSWKGIERIVYLTFDDFRQNGKHGDRSINTGSYSSPLFNVLCHLSCGFRSCGMFASVENERLISLATLGAITGAAMRRKRALILSILEAF